MAYMRGHQPVNKGAFAVAVSWQQAGKARPTPSRPIVGDIIFF